MYASRCKFFLLRQSFMMAINRRTFAVLERGGVGAGFDQ